MRTLLALTSIAMVLPIAGCGAAMRRYPLAEPMWSDPDSEAFGPAPPEWYSPYMWDGADNSVFRPLAEVWRLQLAREAINVNAVDEVPSSSWFTNRLSVHELSPEVVAAGACHEADPGVADADIEGPFTITGGKPDGSSPGFFVRDGRGVTYLMKPDGGEQAGRWAASDAIGAAVFWAAGYNAPCNRVVFAPRDAFVLEEGAEARYTSGHREPLTQETVDEILDRAAVDEQGQLRFGLSQFVEGEPIAPWTYAGTWDRDPNDVVPHEHRREVRAMYVLSSWLSHIDSRQENTLASWIEVGEGTGYVRHYMLDFSDTLGILHPVERLAARFGHSGYFDLGHMFEDLVTLGAIQRPWDEHTRGRAGAVLGNFDVDHYVPDQWRPGYPNPAYERMTERDAAWMARILARFSDAHVHALSRRGRWNDVVVERELERVLAGRRDRALERWLGRLSPLSLPVAEGRRACSEDLAVVARIRRADARRYAAQAWTGEPLVARDLAVEVPAPGRACVVVPRTEGGPQPAYVVVDLTARTGDERVSPLRFHAYDVGDDDVRIVGVELPDAHD